MKGSHFAGWMDEHKCRNFTNKTTQIVIFSTKTRRVFPSKKEVRMLANVTESGRDRNAARCFHPHLKTHVETRQHISEGNLKKKPVHPIGKC